MRNRPLLPCLIALCLLALHPLTVRAEGDAPALPKHATQAMRYSYPNCGDKDRPSAFTPDGLLAVGCDDGYVQLLNPATGAVVWQSPANNSHLKYLVSPDANTLLAINEDRKVIAYDLITRTERARYTLPIATKIYDIQGAGGRLLAVAPAYKEGEGEGEIHLYDDHPWTLTALSATDGKVIATRTLAALPAAYTLSPDGALVGWVASNTDDNSAQLNIVRWTQTEKLGDADHQKSPCDIDREIWGPSALQFSSDSKVLAAAAHKALCLHTLDGSAPDRILRRPEAEDIEGEDELSSVDFFFVPSAIRFSADNQHVNVAVEKRFLGRMGTFLDGMTTYYADARTGALSPSAPSAVWAYSPTVIDLPGHGVVALYQGNPVKFAYEQFHREGEDRLPLLLSAPLVEGSDAVVMRLPYTSLNNDKDEDSSGERYSLRVSPDGRWLSASDEQRVLVWDINAGPTARPHQIPKSFFEEYSYEQRDPVFSDDSMSLITATGADQVTLWRLGTFAPTRYKVAHTIKGIYASAAPGEVLLCEGGRLSRMDLKTGEVTPGPALLSTACPAPSVFSAASQRVLSLIQSEDYLETSLSIHEVKGDTPSDTTITAITAHKAKEISDTVWSYVLSADGQLVAASTESGVEVFKADTKERVAHVAGATATELSISPNNQWMAFSNGGEFITLLHIGSNKTVKLTPKPTVTSKALTFSPDSKTLISLHSRDRIFFWDINAALPAR
jgi:WD40 repeat protein